MEKRKNNFNALLAKKGMRKVELAEKLGVSKDVLFRRIRNGCDFYLHEIDILMSILGEQDVIEALFNA